MMKHGLAMMVCVAWVALGPLAAADEPKAVETARTVMKEHSKAVVYVSAVAKITTEGMPAGMGAGGMADEQKVKVLGTVVDPSGLTVVPNLDPTASVGSLSINIGGMPMELAFKAEISAVKIRLADGTEVPGRIVLKDDDLNVAFVAPMTPLDEKTRAKISHVDLTKSDARAKPLDRVVTLARLGKVLNHQLNVRISRITAVVTKPRTFYVGPQSLGAPVFTETGSLLGICVLRSSPGGSVSIGLTSALGGGGKSMSATSVVLPAADVAELAEQAKEEMKKKPQPQTEPETKPQEGEAEAAEEEGDS